jgi:hypothetical protein
MYLDKSIATCKTIVSLLLQKCRASNANFTAPMKKKKKFTTCQLKRHWIVLK